ncbi:response regulator [Nostoc sp. FACHB-152]|uniref:ATP-binding protein n=1 Tax=unclassified Nostoc TaxID=2593658 RepID=UPI0016897A3A|nr:MULTISPECIES: ATP-binding protein [unclassified Nostoc]MBD2449756.1 response regulator [Nostoc sp. FACHB-152]MBD2469867.1 response regulator [Nostoc sp. FACHB-145]
MNQNHGQNWLSGLVKNVPLSRVLVVPFLLQISLAVGLTGYLSFRNGQKAVNTVTSELRQVIANQVRQDLQTFLSTPHQVLNGNKNALQFGLLNMQDITAWEPYLMQQLELFPSSVSIAVSNQQKEYLFVEKLNNDEFLISKSGRLSNYNLYSYKIDSKGKRTQLPEVIKNFDPRSRPFYQTAVQQKQFSFSQIYAPLTEKNLQISASVPIYNSQGKLLGVNNTMIHLSDIGKHLRNFRVGKSGQIFIIDRTGFLVASSTGEQPFLVKDGRTVRLAATQSSNSLTQATSKYLASKFRNLHQIHRLQELEFSIAGQRQFIEIEPFNTETNINWLIAVVIPESDFMGQINRHTQITILLCLAAFLLATVLGILTTRWIAKPVLRLSKAAKTLAGTATSGSVTNETESVVFVEGIAELEVLGQSFNQMSGQLRASFEELEMRVEQRTQELQQEIFERIQNEQQLSQHSQALAELAKHRSISEGDLETAFHIITEKAAQALEVERVSIWLYSSDRSKLQCVDLYERSHNRHSAGQERSRAEYPMYFAAVASSRTITVNDTRNDARVQEFWYEQLEPNNIVSLMDAPIWVGGEVVGMVFNEQVGITRQWTLIEQNFAGSITDFVALTLEVCDRQRAEVALRQAKEAAEVANLAKSAFLANMSHELRTPLNAILGITEALQDEVCGPVTEEQHKSLKTLERSGKHLLELINDILDLAKIESGKMELELSPTSVQGLCESSLTFVKQQAFKKNIRLNVQIPENINKIQVDERRIRQLLINLLSNAVKFTPDNGEVRLEVTTQIDAITNQLKTIQFSVVDTGIGITPENLSNLFQPFVQVENTYTRRYAGTGLGLSLVKRIAELHGGSISVESEVNQGSRFTVTLPCKEPERQIREVVEETEIETRELVESGNISSAPLILLAEDNEANVLTITQYLEAYGYRIVLANNGEEAVEIAKTQRPQLILMDVQMPEMDGLEATRQIRADADIAHIPIIALTSFAMRSDKEQIMAVGVDSYMSKPVSLKQLVAEIAKYLSHLS